VSDPAPWSVCGLRPGIAIGKPLVVENRRCRVMRVPLSPGHIEPEVTRLASGGEAGRAAPHWAGQGRRAHLRRRVRLDLRGAPPDCWRTPATGDVDGSSGPRRSTRKWRSSRSPQAPGAFREARPTSTSREKRQNRTRAGRGGASSSASLQAGPVPRYGHGGELGILVADDIPPSQAIQLASRASAPSPSETGGPYLPHNDHRKSLGSRRWWAWAGSSTRWKGTPRDRGRFRGAHPG